MLVGSTLQSTDQSYFFYALAPLVWSAAMHIPQQEPYACSADTSWQAESCVACGA